MPKVEPWNRTPSIHDADMHPNAMAARLREVTGRRISLQEFDDFKQFMLRGAQTPEALLPYVHLTKMFPRCTMAVLDGLEKVSQTDKPLMLIVRIFPGCTHALLALYDWQPVPLEEDPWVDGMWDHVRLWTWKHCEICEAKGMKPS
jgi:hypothetical protein